MNRFKTTLFTTLIALLALGTIPALGQGNKAIDMLEKARAKMQELADKDLRGMDVGKQTQDKEEAVIQQLEALIQMILDEQAKQQQQQQSSQMIGGEKPGDMVMDTPTKEGGLKEGIVDTAEPSRDRGEEWGREPEREFEDTSRDSDVPAIPGYEKIVKRYREVKSSRQNSVGE